MKAGRLPTQRPRRQVCAFQLPCLCICSSSKKPAGEHNHSLWESLHLISSEIWPMLVHARSQEAWWGLLRKEERMNGNRTTWPHLAQASRVSLQKPQFPQPSTGSRSFLANSFRSSVYLWRTDTTDVRFITDACSSYHLKWSFLATKKEIPAE